MMQIANRKVGKNMCNFFSVTSDGKGNIKYFDWEQRQKILTEELTDDGNIIYPDSHTSINSFYGYQGEEEDIRNKYEYNPLTGKFTMDEINSLDDSKEVEEKVRALDFKTIVEPLIIKPIVKPFEIEPPKEITEEHVSLLKQWSSVRDSVRYSVVDSVRDSIGYSVRNSIRNSIGDSVWDSVRDSVVDSVVDSVWYSVRDFIYAYISSFFYIKKWEYIDHEPYQNPFQSAIDLWEMGLVASYDGKIWRLHGGKDGTVMYEMER